MVDEIEDTSRKLVVWIIETVDVIKGLKREMSEHDDRIKDLENHNA